MKGVGYSKGYISFGILLSIVIIISSGSNALKMKPKQSFSPNQISQVANGGMSMLELSTRPWLYNLSLKYGTNITRLADIPDQEFQDIAAKNIQVVWMMGVWQLGAYGLHHDRTDPGLLSGYAQTLPGYTTDDIIGSPYAVTEYTCNSELGSDDDILALKSKLNSMGLLLMLDFVPNHSAVDCSYAQNNDTMDYYVLAPKGTQPPFDPTRYYTNGIAYGACGWGCSWTDTLQFNYWNPATAKMRIGELMHVASLADAIRCDMAYLLLNDVFQQNWNNELNSWGWNRPSTEWWSDSISAVKQQYPNVIFLAEVYSPYEPNLQQCGFDYTYDKTIYDKLGSNDLDGLRSFLSSNSLSYFQHSAHFVSNHDEERAADYFGSWWRADAAALLTYTLPGMRFYWMWEKYGYSAKLDVHLRRETTQTKNTDVEGFYNQLWSITNTDVFNKGTWTYLPVSNSDSSWRLIAYSWQYNNQKRLCVINFSDTQASSNIMVPNAQSVNGNDTIPVTDLLSGQTYYRSAQAMRSQGLDVVVNSWYAQIFQY